MKFGKILETAITSDFPIEWRPYMIQYKTLKKYINRIVLEMNAQGLPADVLHKWVHSADDGCENEMHKVEYSFSGTFEKPRSSLKLTLEEDEDIIVSFEKRRTSSESNSSDDTADTKESNHETVAENHETPSHDTIKVIGGDSTESATKNGSSKPTRTIIIELSSDTNFFSELSLEIAQAQMLEQNTVDSLSTKIVSLGKELSTVASPYKKDLYTWRDILKHYMDAEIFAGVHEQDRSRREWPQSREQFQSFLTLMQGTKLPSRLSKTSALTFEKFIDLTATLISMNEFHALNQLAMHKILKKHDKRSGLTAAVSFPKVVGTAWDVTAPERQLELAVTENLLTIIPQPEDYYCPVCLSIAWRPIRLPCSHVFCVRCLVKAQRKKMDHCPMCREENAVRKADANMLDAGLENFLKLYFPKEVKQKKKENEKEVALEEVEAMTGMQWDGQKDDCIIM